MSHNYILLSASALSDIYICNYPAQLLMLNLFCFVLGEGIFEEIKFFLKKTLPPALYPYSSLSHMK